MRSGLTILARLALTATAIAPVGFTYAAVAALNKHYGTMLLLLAGSALLVRLCVWVLNSIKSRTGVDPKASSPEEHPITFVEPADRENTAIILLYLMPLFTADFNDLNWIVWVPTILVFAVIAMTSHSYFFNPLLGLFGWHFYRVGTPENVTRLLISKQTINKGDRTITGIQLSDYVILDTE
tara:strand:- start:995 stop:1540 length:546 start_codon:yes stop_codon:yes gene_type:complete